MNMFGYDDDELNQILFDLAEDPTVMVQVTLDKSQASGVHEKKILASDTAADPAVYAADFAVGQSDTHQISHTKGGILDGIVALRRLDQLVDVRRGHRHHAESNPAEARIQGAEQHSDRLRQRLRDREVRGTA